MKQNPPSIALVTPVWNDSKRLSIFGAELAMACAKSEPLVQWLIADDGSSEEERAALRLLTDQFRRVFAGVELYLAPRHEGKGGVIRSAWATQPRADWYVFVDADGSVSATDLFQLIQSAVTADQSVIGIRKRTENTQFKASLWRSFFHRGFLLAADLILGLDSEDLQCGAKVIRGDDYRKVERGLREVGFVFDCELLHQLNRAGLTWKEMPVNWIGKNGGTIKPLREAWRMFLGLLRVRANPSR